MWSLSLDQICREPLEKLLRLYGGSIGLRPQRYNSFGTISRPMWAWRLHGRKRLEPTLTLMLPFLTTKREQAELALDFCATFLSGRAVTDDLTAYRTSLAERISSMK